MIVLTVKPKQKDATVTRPVNVAFFIVVANYICIAADGVMG